MADKSSESRTRRRSPRRASSSDQQARQSRGGRGRQDLRPGRLSREEIEWARDLWLHRETPEEIAHQLGIEVAEAEALVASWEKPQPDEAS